MGEYIDPYGFSGGGKPSAGGSPHGGGKYIDPYGFSNKGIAGGPATRGMRSQHGGGGIGGFFGKVGHFIGSKASLAGHDIAAMPGGVYHLGKDFEKTLAMRSTWHSGGRSGEVAYQSPLARDVRGMVESSKQSFEHPLRDPFQTALNLAPAVNVAGKFGEAGLAAREAAATGDESAAAAAARALLRRHGDQPARVLRSGEKETNLLPSRNAGVRLAQRGYDSMVQRAMDKEAQGEGVNRVTARIAEHGKARIGGALAEEQRAVQRMNSVPADRLERSALRLSKLPLKAGGKIHSAALELTSTQTAPEDAARFHEEQAAAGVNPEQNSGVAKLYRKVAQHDLVHVDLSRPDGQKVFINPAHTKLAAADAALAHAGAEGERMISEHNLMSPEGQQERINAPARLRAGAEYVKPTPGKLGIESPVLKEARAQLAKAEKLHAQAALKAMGKVHMRGSVMSQFASREMTDEEAAARLAELDKQHEELANKLVPHVSQLGGKDAKIEQLRRNEIAGKIKKGKNVNGVSKPTETVKEENLRLADEKMRALAKEHAGSGKPWADALQKLLNERDELRHTLQSRADAPIFGHEPPPLPHVAGPGYNYALPYEHDPLVKKMSGAVSYLKDKVQKLEAAQHNRIQPTGLIGGENALPGRTFTGYRTSEKLSQSPPLSVSSGKTIGEARSPIDSKSFTGENIRQGNVPKNTALAGARHYRQIAKFVNTDSLRRAILEHDGSEIKRSPRDILIRKPGEKGKPLSEEMKQALGTERSTVHDQASLNEINTGTQEGLSALHKFFSQHILDQSESSRAMGIGTKAPEGYSWVDEKLAGELQKDAMPKAGGVRTKIGAGADNTNSAITAMTVYFKLGHVFTRALTNAATNIMQGSLRPDETAKSFGLWKKMSDEEKARAVAAAGQQGFSALPHEGSEGVVGRAVAGFARGGSRFWARHFDAPFRFNSLAYELRKIGYDSPEKVREALDAIQHNGKGMPAHEWSKVSAAFRRADREAISYDRLNEFEKKYLTRAVWFYPWVKGSSMFTVRSILEHPYKSAALGNLGVEGRKAQRKVLGLVPSYEQGLVALDHGHNPLTADFSTFSPAATLGQLLNIPEVPGAISQQFNPVLGSGIQYATGTNQYGEPSNNPLGDALRSLVAPTPEAQIAEAVSRGKGKKSSARMFPGMGPLQELERYGLGPGFAWRRVNRAALAKAAHREHAKRYTVYSK